MIPKKPNQIFNEVAEELEISSDLVDKFITFYYKEVRKHLSELSHIRVNIDGLGHMVVKRKTIDKLIVKYENMIAKADTYSFPGYFTKKKLETRLEALSKAKNMLNKSDERKQEFLNKKYESKKNMDK